jgi:flagellar basal body rod protein FlgC
LATAANNIANMHTNGRTAGNGQNATAYTPKETTLHSQAPAGVRAEVTDRPDSVTQRYDPSSIYADAKGMIAAPDISLETEIMDMKTAEIAYKANIGLIKASEEMQDSLLETLA